MRAPRFVLLTALILLSGCGSREPAAPVSPAAASVPAASWAEKEEKLRELAASDPLWAKRLWLERAARLLRGGFGLGPDDDLDALLKLPEEVAARSFMNDARFGDATLDFGMYFLGFRADSIREPDGISYTEAAFSLPSAVTSARETLRKDGRGDFLKLFEFTGDYFMPPLGEYDEDEDGPKKRLAGVNKVKALYRELIAFGKKRPRPAAFCGKMKEINPKLTDAGEEITELFERGVVGIERGELLAEGADEEACPNVDVAGITEDLEEHLALFTKRFEEVLRHENKVYAPKTVLEFRPFDLRLMEARRDGKWVAFSGEQGQALANSSTNMNRKRGAYVLKQFFCDDLTPVGFEAPDKPTDGPHGSETSCFACHFKLDPMAGFFRGIGANFGDYSSKQELIFDDEVRIDRARYEQAWKAPAGAGRAWNVGYVRSPDPRFDSKNAYGESLADLTAILRAAPEVKRCLMKKLFEYFTGEGQAVDGAWLDEAARKFDEEARVSSAAAFRNAVVRTVTSRTFSQPDPSSKECYDYGPGGPAPGAPPCRVAQNLKKNCVQCHSSVYGPGNLDLSGWALSGDGKRKGFPHHGDDDKPLPARETFQRLLDRLSTSDVKRRMPKNAPMPGPERQDLFLWAQEQLAEIEKTEAAR